MAAAVSTVGAVNRAPVNLNGSVGGAAVPSSSFMGMSLKKVNSSYVPKVSSGNFKVVAEVNEKKQTDQDRWKGLVEDISDDQQDIARGKGMVDSLFQAPTGMEPTTPSSAPMNTSARASASNPPSLFTSFIIINGEI
ncbi:UNVERIFIED_CONTAM: Ribulose bisphosphate carboxylase/oxygenase activase, chloroplastic [Sesamum latifolium]|uniref:Ribulose bisphosphate carboxylase/oxygenase activase, chloroplastic n=1 Tax=Sesamum latifolium TaxID=2727402 RepID=A0AAW2XGI0_9LAMI